MNMSGFIKGPGDTCPRHIPGFCILILVLKCKITIYLKKMHLFTIFCFWCSDFPLKSQRLGFKTHPLQFFFVNRAPIYDFWIHHWI